MSKGINAKAFSVMLVDMDYYDEVKTYLRSKKHFLNGRGIYYVLESGLKVIYFLVEYSKVVQLDIDKLPYCRVRKAYKASINKFNMLMEQAEEVWNEGAFQAVFMPKQKTIDAYINTKIK